MICQEILKIFTKKQAKNRGVGGFGRGYWISVVETETQAGGIASVRGQHQTHKEEKQRMVFQERA